VPATTGANVTSMVQLCPAFSTVQSEVSLYIPLGTIEFTVTLLLPELVSCTVSAALVVLINWFLKVKLEGEIVNCCTCADASNPITTKKEPKVSREQIMDKPRRGRSDGDNLHHSPVKVVSILSNDPV
jgi:hypothetical protein